MERLYTNQHTMRNALLIICFCLFTATVEAQNPVPAKPRILISTDIGGTDPDDNQSYGKSVQKWPGYYLGHGKYVIRYIPKQAETLHYKFTSSIPELNGKEGSVVVNNLWPGKKQESDYMLGENWYSDKSDKDLYDGILQGGKTIQKWRTDILMDWAKRWEWLR